jgi:hypothetical protein
MLYLMKGVRKEAGGRERRCYGRKGIMGNRWKWGGEEEVRTWGEKK